MTEELSAKLKLFVNVLCAKINPETKKQKIPVADKTAEKKILMKVYFLRIIIPRPEAIMPIIRRL